ncbi:MAG: PfkB family carbohydrate kinase [Anaerolineae bacterium]|nr:PfkB family carbohydrate kinase [Anaerolineae bacterium]
MTPRSLQIVGLGMATLDVLLRLKDMPTWDHGTRLSDFSLQGGGPVGTAMVAAAKLGSRVGFISTVGNDIAGELKMRSFHEVGIDLSHLVQRDIPENQVVIVYVHAETGERVFSGITRFGDTQIKPEELDRAYITSADYLHLDGYHSAAAMEAAQWMRAAGKTVVLDGSKTSGPVGQHLRQLVRHVDVLISGSGFVQGLTGEPDLRVALEAALDHGPRIVVQTEGADGAYTVTRGPTGVEERFHTPAFACNVVDTTGAGDVFHGAYIVGLLHGWDVRQTARFAAAVSAIKCTRLGGRAGIPTFEETQVFLEKAGAPEGWEAGAANSADGITQRR